MWLAKDSPGPGETSARRRPGWVAWIAGIVFNAILFWWIVRLPAKAMTQPWIIYPALLALAAYLGIFVALFGWAVRFIRRRVGWSPLVTAPAVWGASEWLKSAGALGCPWGNLGYSLAGHPAWIQGAAVFGAPGLSVWIVSVNALLAGALLAKRWSARSLLISIAVVLVAAPPIWGSRRMREFTAESRIRVALVQPNIGSEEKWDAARQERSVTTLARLSRDAGALIPRPDLIVWPETALPFYVRLEFLKLKRLFDLVREVGVPMLVGYPDARFSASGGVMTHNAAGLVLPLGTIAAQYDKIHLVPFGERIPFQGVFPFLGKLDLGQAEWTPGVRPVVFPLGRESFGVLICFESIFPGLSRSYGIDGARFLVNITNDEWFGRTAAPRQHADMAILRCVEQGIGMARCANTGISMFVDPVGRVSRRSALFEEALITGDVLTSSRPTLFRAWGDWLSGLSLGLTIVLVLLGWYRPLRPAG